MSKQFVKGNVYVFTKKKYIETSGSDYSDYKTWVNMINGNKVTIDNRTNGSAGKLEMFVIPGWCKCIKNNNPIIKSEVI